MIVQWLKKKFPAKAKSLDGFIEQLRRSGAISIDVKFVKKKDMVSPLGTLYSLSFCQYGIRLKSQTSKGWPIIYEELFEEGLESFGMGTYDAGINQARYFMEIDKRLDKVRELSKAQMNIFNRDGIRSNDDYQKEIEKARLAFQ